ncbi:cytochrome d ubiquinol oxidase subunit II [Burkholderia sp. NLJ2]|uniref:cytochrome d ubiquinol oxidase subunit II n=1 Tax=Burkholderia sp. NLJ2 TaxID=3090699 RepID=UPI003C6C88F0
MLAPDTLQLTWWILIVVLFCAFVVTDGFDFGALILLPWVAKSDERRRVVLNAIGPTWEGNQTWLICAIGATFAAWPLVYGVTFSGLYVPMMLALFSLFARPVGFDYRSKLKSRWWRVTWDSVLCGGGFISASLFGLVAGNLFVGLPFTLDQDYRLDCHVTLFDLLHAFPVTVALATVAMCMMHGGAYVQRRVDSTFSIEIGRWTTGAALAFAVLFASCALWVATTLPGLHVSSLLMPAATQNENYLSSQFVAGGWARNFVRYPWLAALPVSAWSCSVATAILSRSQHWIAAFCASSIAVLSVVGSVAVALFPVLVASSENPAASLTVWNATSSPRTLQVMLFVAVIFVPLIVLYTNYVYRTLRGKITVEMIRDQSTKLY